MKLVYSSLILVFLLSCTAKKETDQTRLFSKIPSSESNMVFTNNVENFENFNIFSYRNFYNGGGVAIGDINNDGLADVYLTSNLSKNKLFLNKGNFQFEDITEASGTGGDRGWSTGVVMVDINQDRLLDIYVCNAGYVEGDDQENELFINNGDGTFTERAAEYNLNDNGYTTHTAFFDYDRDGDLDAYVLNNSFIPVNTLNYSNKRELYAEDWPVKDFIKGGGDKLLRNDNGKFVNVTKEAGIYGSLIGFGLGVTVGDVNGDHLEDIYVSNDFFERDYLYINQGDGTFSEEIKDWMGHISLSSMGSDMGDINNDGYPEIFVTEMLPADEDRLKTKVLFENYQTYQLKLDRDFYHQYMHNTLQLNNRNQSYSEIAWYSGVSASDWSWGALMLDVDNDGLRDILVCNGIYQDVTDQDFIDFFANDIIQKMVLSGKKEELNNVLKEIPSNPIPNKMFINNGDLTFNDKAAELGLGEPSFSNGAAYGDLDNDGDIDLVISNVNQEVFLYRNNSDTLTKNNSLSVELIGDSLNTYGIGSKITVFTTAREYTHQLIPSRGFQSSMDYRTIIGLGSTESVDSVKVEWPDLKISLIKAPSLNEILIIDHKDSESKVPVTESGKITYLEEVDLELESHREDEFVDFYQEGMVIRMLSREGPTMATGDVNNDGKMDVFIGGAALQNGLLYKQTGNSLEATDSDVFKRDAYFEDTASEFFDADGDGDLDLYVGSGGNQQQPGGRLLQDRLYINDGSGVFTFERDRLPKNGFNTSVVLPLDYDKDGDMDLFVGSRSVPGIYGVPPESYVFENDGRGYFRDATTIVAPALEKPGMITDAHLVDVNGDKENELVITGEWMAPLVLEIRNGKFVKTESNLQDYSGWWYAVTSDDVDGDGDMDLILGNRGENFYFTGTPEAPAKLWLSDFDQNGTVEKLISKSIDGRDIPIPLKRELTEQLVSLKKKNLKHSEYADKSVDELFDSEQLGRAVVLTGNWFKSSVAINDGNGNFELKPLPAEVQLSCICAIYCQDLNGDNLNDMILGGNFDGFTPQFSKLDANYGQVLINKGNGDFEVLEGSSTGILVNGDMKAIKKIELNGTEMILTTVNNQKPRAFKIKKVDEEVQ